MTRRRALLATLFVLAGCAGGRDDTRAARDGGHDDERDTPVAANRAPAVAPPSYDAWARAARMTDDSLSVELSLPAEITSGASFPFALTVTNAGRARTTLYLRGREIAWDAIVTDAAGDTVWRRLDGKVIEAVVRLEELAPGDTLRFRDAWDQRTRRRGLVAAGEYRMQAHLLTDAQPLVTTPVTFRLVDP